MPPLRAALKSENYILLQQRLDVYSPVVHKIVPAGAMRRSRSRSDANLSESFAEATMKRSASGSQLAQQLQPPVPEITEERVGIVVSKKGWMNFLEGKTKGWIKRWVVIRRPYVLQYRDDRDLVSARVFLLMAAQT